MELLHLVSYVSALSDARTRQNAVEQVLGRAFDKAVRRKPLAFAADAVGLWELNVGGGGTRLTQERRAGVCRERVVHIGRLPSA